MISTLAAYGFVLRIFSFTYAWLGRGSSGSKYVGVLNVFRLADLVKASARVPNERCT